MNGNQIEIYKQRYETFRHLDKLRWQMLQISLALGALTTSFSSIIDGRLNAIAVTFCGVAMILLCVAMDRIGSAIRANGQVLAECGSAVGDPNIMKPKSRFSSSAFWISLTVAAFGTFLLVDGATKLVIK